MGKLKDTPNVDRPREKFLAKGADALTKSELLAILLGSGIKGTNIKELSQKILHKFGNGFLHATVDELVQIPGIGKAKALQIVSALALARRIHEEQNSPDNKSKKSDWKFIGLFAGIGDFHVAFHNEDLMEQKTL